MGSTVSVASRRDARDIIGKRYTTRQDLILKAYKNLEPNIYGTHVYVETYDVMATIGGLKLDTLPKSSEVTVCDVYESRSFENGTYIRVILEWDYKRLIATVETAQDGILIPKIFKVLDGVIVHNEEFLEPRGM